jgi:RecA-family ATPase
MKTSSPFDGFCFQQLGQPGPKVPDVPWIWRGYLAPGQLTLLTSLWKSGKTTLLSVLLSRLNEGGHLLGMPILPTKALVLSEENRDLWTSRSQRLDFGEHINLISRPFAGKPTAAEWQNLIEHSAAVLGREGNRLLVVDTMSTLLPAGTETNADCMVRALAPLHRLAEQGIAVWLMHHPHKGKLRTARASRGTGSLPASVDIVLEMHHHRPDDPYDRRRLLLAHSRHEETPRRLLFEWHPDRADYSLLDENHDEDFDRAWSAIQRVLADYEAPQSARQILRDWPPDSPPPSRATLQRWLAKAVENGLLHCEVSEQRNAPYLYGLTDGG